MSSFPPKVIPLRITALYVSLYQLVGENKYERLQRTKGKFIFCENTEPHSFYETRSSDRYVLKNDFP